MCREVDVVSRVVQHCSENFQSCCYGVLVLMVPHQMPVIVLAQVRLFGCGLGTLVRAPLFVVDSRQEHGRCLFSLALVRINCPLVSHKTSAQIVRETKILPKPVIPKTSAPHTRKVTNTGIP